jgi:hypothetical protein
MTFDLLFYLSVVLISYILTEYFRVFSTNAFIFIVAFYAVFLVLWVYDEVEYLKKELEMLRRCGND